MSSPYTGIMRFACRVCGHLWSVKMHCPIPIERFTKGLDGVCEIGCPSCGKHGEDVLLQNDPWGNRGTNDT